MYTRMAERKLASMAVPSPIYPSDARAFMPPR
jgi:hypothetical protein